MNYFKVYLASILILLYSSNVCSAPAELTEVKEAIAKHRVIMDSCSDISDSKCVTHQLSEMVQIDQLLRDLYQKDMDDSIVELLNRNDLENTERLKKILTERIWVKKSEFGDEADNQAWLIAQHSDHDLDFQHRVLFILDKMVELQETDPKHYAYLYDRVSCRYEDFGLKQKYGTQATFKNDEIIIKPYEGSELDLNNRRSEIGLESIEEYLMLLHEEYS